jgi:hypothetical protein
MSTCYHIFLHYTALLSFDHGSEARIIHGVYIAVWFYHRYNYIRIANFTVTTQISRRKIYLWY